MEEEAPLPFLLELISGAGLKADEVDIVNIPKDILALVMTTQKGLFLEKSAGRHANAGLPARSLSRPHGGIR